MHELVRLRRRFLLILMCSVGLVLTVALIISVASSFSAQLGRIQNSLAAAQVIGRGEELRPRIGGIGREAFLDSADLNEGQDLTTAPDDGPREEFADMVPVYVVDISGDTGEITNYGNAAEMDEGTLNEALSRIQSGSSEQGLFLDLGLFYSQQNMRFDAVRIAFADATQLYSTTLNQALIALLVWVLAMVAFYVLSRALSRMVLRPVEEAWTKQRQFITDASHELKTPLTIILANNNIMQSHPEKTTAEQQQWLESTGEEANRMNDMVTDLLLLAQVENAKELAPESDQVNTDDSLSTTAGRLKDSVGTEEDSLFTTVELSSLVERSLLQFDAVFFERGISSNATIEEGLQTTGNKEHLRRLIDILLDNASKYGDKGGTVDVQLARSKDTPDSALLTVSNTGALVPPEKKDQVFERFYRVDAAHSNAVPGSGLGLALAKEIVREHGGSIRVTSTPLNASQSSEDEAQSDKVSITPSHDESLSHRSVLDELGLTTLSILLPLPVNKN